MTLRRPPLLEHWEPAFARALAAHLAGAEGSVAWAAGRDPRRFFDGLTTRLMPVSPEALSCPPPLATARTLTAAGISFVLTDRTTERVAPWVDSDLDRLPRRLRDALDTPGFVPLVLGTGWVLHRVEPAPPQPSAGLVIEITDDHSLTAQVDPQAADRLRQPSDTLSVIHLAGPPCEVTDRDPAALPWLIETGRHGLRLGESDLPPSRPLTDSLPAPVLLLETAVREAALESFLRPARHPAVARTRPRVLYETAWRAAAEPALHRVPYESWLTGPDGPRRLYRGVPLVETAAVDRQRLRHALRLAADRLAADQMADGAFHHLYRPGEGARGRATHDRQRLICRALLAAHRITPTPQWLAAANTGLALALPEPGDRRGTALTLLALRDLQALGHPLPDGTTPSQLTETLCRPPEDAASDAPGTEALAALALARLADQDPRDAILAATLRCFDSARDTWDRWLAARTDDGIWPDDQRAALTSTAPWIAQAAQALHARTGESSLAAFGLAVQTWVADSLLRTPSRCPADDWLGSLFKRHDEAPSITSCRGLSTAAAALSLARQGFGDPEPCRNAALWGARFCLQLQYDDPATTWFVPDPQAARGAFRYSLCHTHARSDWTARTVLALADADAALWPEEAP